LDYSLDGPFRTLTLAEKDAQRRRKASEWELRERQKSEEQRRQESEELDAEDEERPMPSFIVSAEEE
jgi:hypothetical protein